VLYLPAFKMHTGGTTTIAALNKVAHDGAEMHDSLRGIMNTYTAIALTRCTAA
jgi:hypothetical protein